MTKEIKTAKDLEKARWGIIWRVMPYTGGEIDEKAIKNIVKEFDGEKKIEEGKDDAYLGKRKLPKKITWWRAETNFLVPVLYNACVLFDKWEGEGKLGEIKRSGLGAAILHKPKTLRKIFEKEGLGELGQIPFTFNSRHLAAGEVRIESKLRDYSPLEGEVYKLMRRYDDRNGLGEFSFSEVVPKLETETVDEGIEKIITEDPFLSDEEKRGLLGQLTSDAKKPTGEEQTIVVVDSSGVPFQDGVIDDTVTVTWDDGGISIDSWKYWILRKEGLFEYGQLTDKDGQSRGPKFVVGYKGKEAPPSWIYSLDAGDANTILFDGRVEGESVRVPGSKVFHATVSGKNFTAQNCMIKRDVIGENIELKGCFVAPGKNPLKAGKKDERRAIRNKLILPGLEKYRFEIDLGHENLAKVLDKMFDSVENTQEIVKKLKREVGEEGPQEFREALKNKIAHYAEKTGIYPSKSQHVQSSHTSNGRKMPKAE